MNKRLLDLERVIGRPGDTRQVYIYLDEATGEEKAFDIATNKTLDTIPPDCDILARLGFDITKV